MSSNGSASNFVHEASALENRTRNYTADVGRAVTDAVHERFRHSFVYCDECKEKFIGNAVSINKHFNKSHPADDLHCFYCPGKVFYYYKVKDENNKAEKVYYHRCRDWISK